MRFLRALRAAAAALVFATAMADDTNSSDVVAPPTPARLCFPDNFLFGTATAAYQVEGAWNEGGRTPSIWDDACRAVPDLACANVADDFYHRYLDDIKLMVESNIRSFRFSISWSRAMNWDPTTKHMKPNAPGIAFYHALIDELKRNNITPILTIYHWDMPTELEHQLTPGSWLNEAIQDHFVEFATLLFTEFGSKVEYWATFNEPLVFTMAGYGMDVKRRFAPGMPQSETNQYTVAHNVLLSHAKAVQKFRELKAQNVVDSKARIGMVLNCDYGVPADPSDPDDVAAVDIGLQFYMGWFLNPIVSGEYPTVMRERVGDRLPQFTPEQAALVKGSYDLFMLNHYNTHEVTTCNSPRSKKQCENMTLGWERDLGLDYSGVPVNARRSSKEPDGSYTCEGFSAVPHGYRDVIRWLHSHNQSTDILLTENGFCGNEEIDNQDQVWYHQAYLEQVLLAMGDDSIPIIGYTAWSFMDNYEWGSFKPRFGLYYVNYTNQTGSKDSWTPKSTDLTRVPRAAAKWFAELSRTGCMNALEEEVATEQVTPSEQPVVVSIPASTQSAWTSWATAGVVVALVAAVVLAVVFIRRRRSGDAREQSPLLRA